MHTYKLPAHRNTVISDCREYFGLFLVLITVFAQPSISLITLRVGEFYMICKNNFIFDPQLLVFLYFYVPIGQM